MAAIASSSDHSTIDTLGDDQLDTYFQELEDLEWGRLAYVNDWLEHNCVERGVW